MSTNFDEIVQSNRSVEAPGPETVSPLPKGYIPLDAKLRTARLRKMPENSRAEGLLSLDELASKGSQLGVDLGKRAPDPAQVAELVARLRKLRQTKDRLQSALSCVEDLEDISLHDAVNILERAHGEYERFVSEEPQLVSEYPSLARFFQDRSDSIRDGIARARALQTPTNESSQTTDDKKL